MTDAPISWKIAVTSIPADGASFSFSADEAAKTALAQTNDVVSVNSFDCEFRLHPAGREGFVAHGRVEAVAVRTCVVTLEPFPETVSEAIEVRFEPGPTAIVDEQSSDDPPEPIVDGQLDLGSVSAEFFTLALDPYPRKPGAVFATEPDEDEDSSPFAALRRLRDSADRSK